jgi:hypothetical protein
MLLIGLKRMETVSQLWWFIIAGVTALQGRTYGGMQAVQSLVDLDDTAEAKKKS